MLVLADWLISSPTEPPRAGWGVRVQGATIDAIGPHADLRRAYPDDPVHDAAGQIVMPGFVNAHTHLYAPYAHGLPLDKAPADFWAFLHDFWWPLLEDQLDHAMIAAAADWSCAEMLQSGVTSFYDCLEAPFALPGALLAQKAVVDRHGMRAVLSFEATERVSAENGQQGLRENTSFIAHCRAEGGLVQGMMCCHTTFTCSADFIRQTFALAAEHGVLTQLHVSEGPNEPAYAQEHLGMRPLEYYEQLGVAGPGMLASQCTQLSQAEEEIIAARGVRVSHIPLGNCYVGGGIAPIPRLLAAGVTVGLGSNGFINDAFELMRGAFLLHKGHHANATLLPAAQVLYLATEGSARTIGLERVGRLAAGWAADMVLLDAAFPTPPTEGNLYDQIVLWRNQRHVQDVMIAGVWRLRNGTVRDADLAAIRARLHEHARTIWARAQA